MKTKLIKRLKALLWSAGMMGLAAMVAFLIENIGALELSPTVTVVAGLVLAQISKFINNELTSK